MSFVNEIDDVVYILTVLSFFIFIGCYYLFRTLSLSFYYTHYCKILLYYIIYYIVNTQFSLVAASFFFTNKLAIYLSTYLSNKSRDMSRGYFAKKRKILTNMVAGLRKKSGK